MRIGLGIDGIVTVGITWFYHIRNMYASYSSSTVNYTADRNSNPFMQSFVQIPLKNHQRSVCTRPTGRALNFLLNKNDYPYCVLNVSPIHTSDYSVLSKKMQSITTP